MTQRSTSSLQAIQTAVIVKDMAENDMDPLGAVQRLFPEISSEDQQALAKRVKNSKLIAQMAAKEAAMYTHKAVSNIANKIDSEDERVSLDASKEILDRGGVPKLKANINVEITNFANDIAD